LGGGIRPAGSSSHVREIGQINNRGRVVVSHPKKQVLSERPWRGIIVVAVRTTLILDPRGVHVDKTKRDVPKNRARREGRRKGDNQAGIGRRHAER